MLFALYKITHYRSNRTLTVGGSHSQCQHGTDCEELGHFGGSWLGGYQTICVALDPQHTHKSRVRSLVSRTHARYRTRVVNTKNTRRTLFIYH